MTRIEVERGTPLDKLVTEFDCLIAGDPIAEASPVVGDAYGNGMYRSGNAVFLRDFRDNFWLEGVIDLDERIFEVEWSGGSVLQLPYQIIKRARLFDTVTTSDHAIKIPVAKALLLGVVNGDYPSDSFLARIDIYLDR